MSVPSPRNKKISDLFSTENHRSKFFVEVMENGLVGSISALIYDDIAELADFYVIEGPEDTVLRSVLLERALNYCRSQKIDVVNAVVFPDLSHFFKRKGFKRKKLSKDHIISRHNLSLMTRKFE